LNTTITGCEGQRGISEIVFAPALMAAVLELIVLLMSVGCCSYSLKVGVPTGSDRQTAYNLLIRFGLLTQ
jgi:hypothetical protein